MVKVLFLIHDLGQGGAEKVLVNLVNNMDQTKFDITIISLFGGGVNEQFLKKSIRYITIFKRMIPGNSKLMKLLTPIQLHRWLIKGKYDVEISYLEGPAARVVSGCPDKNVKLISWIHRNYFSMEEVISSFRSEKEIMQCYMRFSKVICVSQFMKENFCRWIPVEEKCSVLYNTVESQMIRSLSNEEIKEIKDNECVNLVTVGSLKEIKGFDRLLRVVTRLRKENYQIHLYILGIGPLGDELEKYAKENGLQDNVSFLGYQTNPYKYVAKCDLFVCSSYSEGFSTATTEALIVGTPVCTVEVSGMKEMLGEHNEYGVVVENDEESLFQGVKQLLDNPPLLTFYKKQAEIRGKSFSTENTVKAVEEMLLSI